MNTLAIVALALACIVSCSAGLRPPKRGLLPAKAGADILAAHASEGPRANSVLLSGVWEFARGEGNEGAETPPGQGKLRWQQVTSPGVLCR